MKCDIKYPYKHDAEYPLEGVSIGITNEGCCI